MMLNKFYFKKKFKITNEQLEEYLYVWYNKEHILHNALYAVGKKRIDDNEDPYFRKNEQKMKYLTMILDLFGFKHLFDFETKCISDEEHYKKLEESDMNDYETYKNIMTTFDKRMLKEDNEFGRNKIIKMCKCVLNEYGVDLEINCIKKRQDTDFLRIYEYKLCCNMTFLIETLDKY